MTLSTKISPALWATVQSAYETGNYTAAISDSIHYLSHLIRNKSGLDSDGHTLIGEAFGGPNPIIKVNALYTETDKNEQRGIEQLLRGVYSAIRNPRSHEKRTDSNETADVLISFIDYLAKQIDKSRSPFDSEETFKRVFDRHFLRKDKYVDLLISRIPQRKRLDLAIDLFRRRKEGNGDNIAFFTGALLKTLKPEEQTAFWEVVSDALEAASTDGEFKSIIQIAEQEWLQVSEIARLRAEHRMIESMRDGSYDVKSGNCAEGVLGSWARDIATRFTLQEEYVSVTSDLLGSSKSSVRAYAMEYHFDNVRKMRPAPPPPQIIWSLKRRLKEKDGIIRDGLVFMMIAPDEDPWVQALRDAYYGEEESNEITDDDIPF